MLSLFIVLSIIVCIAIGLKTKINIGMLAIVFAYIFGCFALDIAPKAVNQLWPITTFFIILMLAYFYSFAAINGMLEKMAVGILYLFRHRLLHRHGLLPGAGCHAEQKIRGQRSCLPAVGVFGVAFRQQQIAFVNSKIDMGLICACLAVVAMFLDLGDKKAAFARIPCNPLMMVAGVGMLIGVATQAGMLELLGNWMGSNIPAWTVPMALCAVAGLMSFFSSGYGVCAPALFPLVPALSAATGISPYNLFTCALMGLLYSSGSPFSSGGSLMLAAEETDRDDLFSRLLSVGAGYVLLFGIAASLVLYLIF